MSRSPAIPSGPIICRACGYDCSGLPAQSRVRTCPECGRGVLPDGSIAPPARPPEIRCPDCGYNVAGIAKVRNVVNCPECSREINVVYGSHLEHWPGDREAIKKSLWFMPWGLLFYPASVVLVSVALVTYPGPRIALFCLCLAMILSLGEAVAHAHKLAWACWSKRERIEHFTRTAAAAVGIGLAIWAPVVIGTLAVLIFLL